MSMALVTKSVEKQMHPRQQLINLLLLANLTITKHDNDKKMIHTDDNPMETPPQHIKVPQTSIKAMILTALLIKFYYVSVISVIFFLIHVLTISDPIIMLISKKFYRIYAPDSSSIMIMIQVYHESTDSIIQTIIVMT